MRNGSDDTNSLLKENMPSKMFTDTSVYFVTFKKVTFAICCILLHSVAYGCILLHIVEYNEANILDQYQKGIKTWHIQDQNLC